MTAYANIDALNWSSLKLLDPGRGGSPRLYRWRQTHPRPDTDALRLGRALGAVVLEEVSDPGVFERRYFVPDEMTCTATTQKGKRCSKPAVPGDVCCSIHGGKPPDDGREVLTPHQAEVIERCAESLAQNTHAMELLEGTEREKVLLWTVDGVAAKGRTDALKRSALLDLKSLGMALERFGHQAAKLGYHGQIAYYRDGAVAAGELDDDARCYFPVVETVEPYDSAVFEVPDYILDAGRELYQRLLDRWRSCRKLDRWPGRYPKPTQLVLPKWAFPEGEDWT